MAPATCKKCNHDWDDALTQICLNCGAAIDPDAEPDTIEFTVQLGLPHEPQGYVAHQNDVINQAAAFLGPPIEQVMNVVNDHERPAAEPGGPNPKFDANKAVKGELRAILLHMVPRHRLEDLVVRQSLGHLAAVEALALRVLIGGDEGNEVMHPFLDAAMEEFNYGGRTVPVRVIGGSDAKKVLCAILTPPHDMSEPESDRAMNMIARWIDGLKYKTARQSNTCVRIPFGSKLEFVEIDPNAIANETKSGSVSANWTEFKPAPYPPGAPVEFPIDENNVIYGTVERVLPTSRTVRVWGTGLVAEWDLSTIRPYSGQS